MDPNFRRSVLFISTHEASGSFGFIINKPLGHTVAELVPEKPLGALRAVPVLRGGPVNRDQIMFAAFTWDDEKKVIECQHHLSITDAQAALEREHTAVRAFIGYAGWGEKQLDSEILDSSWLTRPSKPDSLDLEKSHKLWRNLVSSFGIKFRFLAEAPENLSLN